MSKRVYKKQNVYEATQDRLKFIFDNFERVCVSFSGGKDSGALLNLVLDYVRRNKLNRRIGVQIMDNEANYEHSLDFMHRILKANLDVLDVYWICLPITLPCAVSSYEVDWQCWGVKDEHRWVRPMPTESYVVNIHNHPFGDGFVENMSVYDFWDMFSEWFSQGKTSANLIGIRTQESLNRFRTIMNDAKVTMKGAAWTKKNSQHAYNCYPIYDWRTRDIWIANAKFDWDYNRLYDIFYMAGIPVEKMRVASPFMSESKSSLNLYRVIDGPTWARLCARVAGANFIATYGKQLNYRSLTLPPGHTWRSFVKFLLSTLPKGPQENFKMRFVQSLKFWGRVGRGLHEDVIADLINNGIKVRFNGTTPHGGNNLRRVIIKVPPDHLDFLKTESSAVSNWKRLALTILKNDHTCKYLGLAPTKQQMERQKQIQKKYKSIQGGK
jgi:predicted phosphoadenosine phosphosulfate sulfurtransferase